MTTILGLSAFYHDSAACVLVDGDIVAAAQEERFTRVKHDAAFPARAIEYCLREAGRSADDVDYVVFYEKPLRKLERLFETYLTFAPQGLPSFRLALPRWVKERAHLPARIKEGLGGALRAPLVFTDHHESHAASAFFPSPFEEAAILTLDGVGEWTTTAIGVGRTNRLALGRAIRFPHSLGLLYSALTYYCGFKVNSGEYKLMGLAPFGRPRYQDLLTARVIDIRPDGSFWLDMKYFNYCQGLTMTSRAMHDLLGGPPRAPDAPIEQRHMDVAASLQAITEHVVLAIGRELHRETGLRQVVLAGGVALNCVANGRLLREGPFERLWIQPAAGDAGGALGAALFVWHQLLERPRRPVASDSQKASLLGPAFPMAEITRVLDAAGATYRRAPDEATLLQWVVDLLAAEKVVGWFHGRMEFGPRALGARSILGDPRSRAMQATMNLKIKFRESFRPFAPVVLQDEAHRWFDLGPGQESPYMLLVAPVRAEHRLPLSEDQRATMASAPDLRERLNVPRSTIPAVTHVDYSARLQTVDAERHPRLTRLLEAFRDRAGCPILVNTSFNVRGEPIVCTPEEAYACFMATDMDALVLEDAILVKSEQQLAAAPDRRARHLSRFQPD